MDNQVDYLIERLIEITSYDMSEVNVFVFGYKDLGKRLTRRLLQMGARVRVGDLLDNNMVDPANDYITYVYSSKIETIKSLINSDDVVINTIPNIFSSGSYGCKSKCIIDIDNYNKDNQKTYIKK